MIKQYYYYKSLNLSANKHGKFIQHGLDNINKGSNKYIFWLRNFIFAFFMLLAFSPSQAGSIDLDALVSDSNLLISDTRDNVWTLTENGNLVSKDIANKARSYWKTFNSMQTALTSKLQDESTVMNGFHTDTVQFRNTFGESSDLRNINNEVQKLQSAAELNSNILNVFMNKIDFMKVSNVSKRDPHSLYQSSHANDQYYSYIQGSASTWFIVSGFLGLFGMARHRSLYV